MPARIKALIVSSRPDFNGTDVADTSQIRPQISVEDGLVRTYAWIEEQVARSLVQPQVTDGIAAAAGAD